MNLNRLRAIHAAIKMKAKYGRYATLFPKMYRAKKALVGKAKIISTQIGRKIGGALGHNDVVEFNRFKNEKHYSDLFGNINFKIFGKNYNLKPKLRHSPKVIDETGNLVDTDWKTIQKVRRVNDNSAKRFGRTAYRKTYGFVHDNPQAAMYAGLTGGLVGVTQLPSVKKAARKLKQQSESRLRVYAAKNSRARERGEQLIKERLVK